MSNIQRSIKKSTDKRMPVFAKKRTARPNWEKIRMQKKTDDLLMGLMRAKHTGDFIPPSDYRLTDLGIISSKLESKESKEENGKLLTTAAASIY